MVQWRVEDVSTEDSAVVGLAVGSLPVLGLFAFGIFAGHLDILLLLLDHLFCHLTKCRFLVCETTAGFRP